MAFPASVFRIWSENHFAAHATKLAKLSLAVAAASSSGVGAFSSTSMLYRLASMRNASG